VVTGLRFAYSNSAQLGGRDLPAKSGWADESIEAAATFESADLYLVMVNDPAAKSADAKADYLVIGELKVEHVAFSAFVQMRLDANGKATEEKTDPKQQPPLVVNGAFVAK